MEAFILLKLTPDISTYSKQKKICLKHCLGTNNHGKRQLHTNTLIFNFFPHQIAVMNTPTNYSF